VVKVPIVYKILLSLVFLQ